MNILNGTTSTTNKGVALAELFFNKNKLNLLESLDILPKNIIFDPEYNNKPGNENYNAEVNPHTGEVTLGQKWVDMFNNPITRGEAIRKLIHEQLHYKLHNRRGYVRSAKEIYNEFKAALDAEGVPTDGHMRAYLFEHLPEDYALEEFLVETLTSQELANKLNSIDAQGYNKKSYKNLLQKVLELMSKVFGWGVRKGSLYEKELYTLRQNFKEAVENKTTIEESSKTKDNVNQDNDITNNTNENQNEINTTTQEQVSTPTVVPPTTSNQPSQFGTYTRRGIRGKFKSSVTEISNNESNYSNEMQTIKEQAIANGTFMKAPNGNPTNLTEKQWLQVRTKAFKEWFGDWENNLSNASKVVDENGEPLVVYHGSKKGINVFKSDGYNNIYFADGHTAMTYGYTPYAVFLNIKNPINIKGNNKSISQASLDYTNNKYTRITGVELNENNADGVIYRNVEDIGPILKEQRKNIIDSWIKIYNNNGLSTIYVVQNPNQIKSATDNIGTFSTTDNDIRHSSITEQSSKVASISTFTDRLPISQQAKFATMVGQGDVKISCM